MFSAMFNEDVLDEMYISDCQFMEFSWALLPILLMHVFFLKYVFIFMPQPCFHYQLYALDSGIVMIPALYFLLKIALYTLVFFLDLCLSAEFLGYIIHCFLVLLHDLYYSDYHLLSKVITPLNSL